MKISNDYEVIVLGAGAGGMTAAAVAAAEGLKVLLIEKSGFYRRYYSDIGRDGVDPG